MIDGQGSGPAARSVARDVAARLTDLLESGSSGEVAALAANQALTSDRFGQVSASFDIVRASADGSLDLARFSTNLVFCFDGSGWTQLDGASGPAGRSSTSVPALHRFTENEAEILLIATDGAGDAKSMLDETCHAANEAISATELVSLVFDGVLAACNGRPKDDVTLAVLRRHVVPAEQRFESFDYSRDVR